MEPPSFFILFLFGSFYPGGKQKNKKRVKPFPSVNVFHGTITDRMIFVLCAILELDRFFLLSLLAHGDTLAAPCLI